ncbi:hypothetical protein HXX76_009384 [Chlamydomonas incerta]|uniref:Uncharacterized protein n=1 Tax=Chlamydomonas incerta TaxID=51695 RepID=A0A835W0R8_CHLIN|nr:hypothetical protein HXX76_009384 [Chlamydomonas incerta]|eukprot:KAG2431891.1 hypothetical protein HXX76_009384 [Chlamydomonas incerta]
MPLPTDPQGRCKLVQVTCKELSELRLSVALQDSAGRQLTAPVRFRLRASPVLGLGQPREVTSTAAGQLALPHLRVGAGDSQWRESPKLLVLEPCSENAASSPALCIYVRVEPGRYPSKIGLHAPVHAADGSAADQAAVPRAVPPWLPLEFEVAILSADGSALPAQGLQHLELVYEYCEDEAEGGAEGTPWLPCNLEGLAQPQRLQPVQLDTGSGGDEGAPAGFRAAARTLQLPPKPGVLWRLMVRYQVTEAGAPELLLSMEVVRFRVEAAPPCVLGLDQESQAVLRELQRERRRVRKVEDLVTESIPPICGGLLDMWGNPAGALGVACRVELVARPQRPQQPQPPHDRRVAAAPRVPQPQPAATVVVEHASGAFKISRPTSVARGLQAGTNYDVVLQLQVAADGQAGHAGIQPTQTGTAGKRKRLQSRGTADAAADTANDSDTGAAAAEAAAAGPSGSGGAAIGDAVAHQAAPPDRHLPDALERVPPVLLFTLIVVTANSAQLTGEIEDIKARAEALEARESTAKANTDKAEKTLRAASGEQRRHEQKLREELQAQGQIPQSPAAAAGPAGQEPTGFEAMAEARIAELNQQLEGGLTAASPLEAGRVDLREDAQAIQAFQDRFGGRAGVLGLLCMLGRAERDDTARALAALGYDPLLAVCEREEVAQQVRQEMSGEVGRGRLRRGLHTWTLDCLDCAHLYDLRGEAGVARNHPQAPLVLDRGHLDLLERLPAGSVPVGFAANLIHMTPELARSRVMVTSANGGQVQATLRQTLWLRVFGNALVFRTGAEVLAFREQARASGVAVTAKLISLDLRADYNVRGPGVARSLLPVPEPSHRMAIVSREALDDLDRQRALRKPRNSLLKKCLLLGREWLGGALDSRIRAQQLDLLLASEHKAKLEVLLPPHKTAGDAVVAWRDAVAAAQQAQQGVAAEVGPQLEKQRERLAARQADLEELMEREQEAGAAQGEAGEEGEEEEEPPRAQQGAAAGGAAGGRGAAGARGGGGSRPPRAGGKRGNGGAGGAGGAGAAGGSKRART